MTKQKQDIKTFVEGVLQRAKNGPRAIFKIDGMFKDVPQDGAGFLKITQAGYGQFIGIYDNKCKANWLYNDLLEA